MSPRLEVYSSLAGPRPQEMSLADDPILGLQFYTSSLLSALVVSQSYLGQPLFWKSENRLIFWYVSSICKNLGELKVVLFQLSADTDLI